jgi:hypothetical protein
MPTFTAMNEFSFVIGETVVYRMVFQSLFGGRMQSEKRFHQTLDANTRAKRSRNENSSSASPATKTGQRQCAIPAWSPDTTERPLSHFEALAICSFKIKCGIRVSPGRCSSRHEKKVKARPQYLRIHRQNRSGDPFESARSAGASLSGRTPQRAQGRAAVAPGPGAQAPAAAEAPAPAEGAAAAATGASPCASSLERARGFRTARGRNPA